MVAHATDRNKTSPDWRADGLRDKLRSRLLPRSATMTIAVRQIHPVFVGEVSGIDTATPLSREDVAAIEAGMDRYAVLVFPDQEITDEQQMAFSVNFGALEN